MPNLYVLGGLLAALIGSTLVGWGFYERSGAAVARAESAEALVSQYKQDLAESEADKALLREMQRKLDVAVKDRDARYAALQKAQKALNDEYAKLRGQVDAADQACLDRDLPPAFAGRLRDPSDRILQNGNPEDTGGPPKPVPQVVGG